MVKLASCAQIFALEHEHSCFHHSLSQILHAGSTSRVRTANLPTHVSNDLQQAEVFLGEQCRLRFDLQRGMGRRGRGVEVSLRDKRVA